MRTRLEKQLDSSVKLPKTRVSHSGEHFLDERLVTSDVALWQPTQRVERAVSSP
jgi:hypothetical protein